MSVSLPSGATFRVRGATGVSDPATDQTSVIESAGALVWRVREELEVQLIHRPRYDDWSWPKGKLDTGETLPTAAAREVAEETGRAVVLGLPLPGLQYLTPDGTVKRVHYWAATRARSDSPALTARAPVPAVDPQEIDEQKWLTARKAMDRLTREADRIPLDALVSEYHKGRLRTTALAVARHGKALGRSSWHGTEIDRPLTPTGHGQSAALVPVLAAFGVDTVITSQWRRCTDTIDPYARAAGITPVSSEHLTEVDHERSPSRVAAVVRALLESETSSVLCTHRPVLPTVLDVLGQHSRRSVASALPEKDPFLDPGQALITHIAQSPKGPRVVGVERVSPPLH